jgi:hypothetical protein
MRLAAAQQRQAEPDEQLYALLSDATKQVHSYAAFVDLGRRVAALTDGQTEVLLDAWCV